jgi:hypothetical protein
VAAIPITIADELGLEGGEEALGDGVVSAVALTAHADGHAEAGER